MEEKKRKEESDVLIAMQRIRKTRAQFSKYLRFRSEAVWNWRQTPPFDPGQDFVFILIQDTAMTVSIVDHEWLR